VIHSGIYYPPNSLKALNCIKGYHQLLSFCDQEGVDYRLCGKLIVATSPNERPTLQRIFERGNQNGLQGLQLLEGKALHDYEPHVKGVAGIWVPQTGIVDYTLVAKKMAEKFQRLGGACFWGHKVVTIKKSRLHLEISRSDCVFAGKLLINCAGLYSDKVAEMAGLNLQVRILPFRGEYFMLRPEKAHLIKTLIYPVPDPAWPFLGVHFTNRIQGGVEAGPNAVFAFQREGYRMSQINLAELWGAVSWPGFRKVAAQYWKTGLGEYYRSWSKKAFTKALQKLVPAIEADDLLPAEAGVRAQACERYGKLVDDFMFAETQDQIHVLNAPSPAATSSLSIGATVAQMALSRFAK